VGVSFWLRKTGFSLLGREELGAVGIGNREIPKKNGDVHWGGFNLVKIQKPKGRVQRERQAWGV